jgi:hypothetical protein
VPDLLYSFSNSSVHILPKSSSFSTPQCSKNSRVVIAGDEHADGSFSFIDVGLKLSVQRGAMLLDVEGLHLSAPRARVDGGSALSLKKRRATQRTLYQ